MTLINRLIKAGVEAMPGECDVYFDAVDRIKELELCLKLVRHKNLTGEGGFSVSDYIAAVLQRGGIVVNKIEGGVSDGSVGQ